MTLTEELQKATQLAASAGTLLLRKSQMAFDFTAPDHVEVHERKGGIRHLLSGAAVAVRATQAKVHVRLKKLIAQHDDLDTKISKLNGHHRSYIDLGDERHGARMKASATERIAALKQKKTIVGNQIEKIAQTMPEREWSEAMTAIGANEEEWNHSNYQIQDHSTAAASGEQEEEPMTKLPEPTPPAPKGKEPKTGKERVAVARTLADPKIIAFFNALDSCKDQREVNRLERRDNEFYPENWRDIVIGGQSLIYIYSDAKEQTRRELNKIEKEAKIAARAEREAGKEKVVRERTEQAAKFMGANPELHAAIEGHKPELERVFKASMEAQLKYLVRMHGDKLRDKDSLGRTIGWGTASATYSSMRFMIARNQDDTVRLNDAEVQKEATKYADHIATVWMHKISGKMAEMNSATVEKMGDSTFLVKGTVGGKQVTIEQQMILNRSVNGTLYNQFPARIYVDGNFMPELKYKKLLETENA